MNIKPFGNRPNRPSLLLHFIRIWLVLCINTFGNICRRRDAIFSLRGNFCQVRKMFRKIPESENSTARQIDKDGGAKNCWNFSWLQETVTFTWKQKSTAYKSTANRMSTATYSAIQTVKYAISSSKQSAVECFQRKDKHITPVNHTMCRLMRGASKVRREVQKKEQEEVQQRRLELSLKHQQTLSKQKALAIKAEADKKARLAHKRQQENKLKALSRKRKAECAQTSAKRSKKC